MNATAHGQAPALFDRYFNRWRFYNAASFSVTAAASAIPSRRCGFTNPRPRRFRGGHLVNLSRWKNADYDKIVDEVFVTSPDDTAKMKELWLKAMTIWLPGTA